MGVVSRREESELGTWTQVTCRPRALGGLVESIWLFDGALRRRERFYPTGELDLIVQLDAPSTSFRVVEGQRVGACPPSSLAGLIVAPLVIETAAVPTRMLGVCLRPAGAYSLIGVPLHELTGTAVDLHDLIGSEARRLTERLDEAGSNTARLDLLGRWITDRLANNSGTDARVAHAVSEIERAGGTLPIATILDRIGASAKCFTSLFEEHERGVP